jgi:hypothetical protein
MAPAGEWERIEVRVEFFFATRVVMMANRSGYTAHVVTVIRQGLFQVVAAEFLQASISQDNR